MSSNTDNQSKQNDNTDGNEFHRQVAKRVFAREYQDASHLFSDEDKERAPKFALLPTGERANRVSIVGTLTETNDIASESDSEGEYWQGRVVDPTGTHFVYAGQYQPDSAQVLKEAAIPTYVAVVGKPRTYETDDGSMYVSLRPESITVVDEATRDRWVMETAEQTLERIEAMEAEDRDDDARLAVAQYGNDLSLYRQDALEALQSLLGDEDETEKAPA